MADESSSSTRFSTSRSSQEANLEKCYRTFRENKVTKGNVWTNHFIDDFQHMISNHHKSLGTFPLVGSMLEASSHLYGMKVDCVHSDALLLSSGIRREKIVETSIEELNETVDLEITSQAILPIRRRRVKTTVVGNKELINAKLQTDEEPNCLLKLKGVNGAHDISTKSLLQNVLASDKYALSLQSQNKFWIDRDAPMNELDDDSAVVSAVSVDLPVVKWVPSSTDVVRSKVTGYEISDIPCDRFRSPTTITADNVNQLELDVDFRFDITADPEPQTERVDLNAEIMNGSFHLTEDDQNSLRRCSALQRTFVDADDLRPLTSTPLEYSYRHMPEGEFPPGTSFWKLPTIRQPGRTTNKRKRRNVAPKDKPVIFKNILPESVEAKFISVDDPLADAVRKSCYVKWNSNKLKKPSTMSWDSLRSFAPGIINCRGNCNVNNNVDAASVAEAEIEEIGDLNPIDVDLADDENSNSISTANELMEVDVAGNVNDDIADVPLSIHSFSPQIQSQLMQITPADRNMKEITKRCLEIICGYEAEEGGEATYAYVYHKLHSRNIQVTPALVLFSILQLANENNFQLKKIGENNFCIKRM